MTTILREKILDLDSILLKMHTNNIEFSQGLTSKEGFLARESEYLTKLSELIRDLQNHIKRKGFYKE